MLLRQGWKTIEKHAFYGQLQNTIAKTDVCDTFDICRDFYDHTGKVANAETYLEPTRTYMELFCENS